MRFLLDTCVLSELRRPRPDAGVATWVSSTDEDRLYLSVVAFMEIQKGITRLGDDSRRAALQNWLDRDLTARFAGRVLPVDAETALTWGTLMGEAERQGTPVPVVDALLAATAAARNLTLVTRKTADFRSLPVRVMNPWGPK